MKLGVGVAVAAVLLVGCGGTALKHVNRIGAGVALASIACDWGQTHSAARAGWEDRYEQNPIMGDRPSPHAVGAYFVSVLAVNALLWYVTPERWHIVQAAAVTGIEAAAIAGNVTLLSGACGIGYQSEPRTGWRSAYDPVLRP